MLTVAEAFEKVMTLAPEPRTEVIDLTKSRGRILAEPVLADRDYPPIDRATMDGIAINASSWNGGIRSWTIENTVAAGVPSIEIRDSMHGCAQIMTGAELPENADGIIPFEDISIDSQTVSANPSATFRPGIHVHAKGMDRQAGDLLISGGVRLDAPRIAILASVGHARVRVAIPPRVGILSTGNEIVPIDADMIMPTQVRASNLTALKAALGELGISKVTCAHVEDDLASTTSEIQSMRSNCDILILSGGVSMGKYDFVPEALRQSGVNEIFHKVAQKPGKPLWFGRTTTGFVFGLPGNPVSTLTVFRRYVVPFILASMGRSAGDTLFAQSTVSISPHPTLTTFPPVSLVDNKKGIIRIEPVTYHGSGDFAALAESDGFVEIPPGAIPLPPMTPLPFFPWNEFGS